ncbi:UNVERIFIED_CONTAM: hypothetical protein K2H54_054653 [Gekko kuhli]
MGEQQEVNPKPGMHSLEGEPGKDPMATLHLWEAKHPYYLPPLQKYHQLVLHRLNHVAVEAQPFPLNWMAEEALQGLSSQMQKV